MKQAKLALTALAVFAVVGGTLAFKANRTLNTFYKYTTSNINGNVTGICDQAAPYRTSYQTTAVGGVVATFSSAPALSVTTCTARVTPIL
ncbi:hypothetical protein [Chitinophaga arvensicola]|uniref:Uncharacterized protein n=1 Tax=Chitinophaga arvensicola TaxID=29529 RepID=A0A1I0SBI1_9BACT|nr:hypothetical protein [Chitinophaga arvensicola]SEW53925.1 hypothetical protein SAMN04488122_5765 [Chitinophaga arvensicola]